MNEGMKDIAFQYAIIIDLKEKQNVIFFSHLVISITLLIYLKWSDVENLFNTAASVHI